MDLRSSPALALISALALSCGAPTPSPSGCPSSSPTARLWVSTSDYASGHLCSLATESSCVQSELDTLTGDSILFAHGSRIVSLDYVRGSVDQIRVYRPLDGGRVMFEGSSQAIRAQGEATANARAYLPIDARRALFSRNDYSSLGVFDVEARAVVGHVALDDFKAGSIRAAPSTIVADGARAFVTLQRWDGAALSAPRNAAIAVVDTTTLAVMDAAPATPSVDAIELPLANPFGQSSLREHALLIPCAGSLQRVGDGGVVRVDTATMQVTGTFADETTLGGNPLHALWLDADRVLLVVMTEPALDREMSVGSTRLVEWSLSSNRVTKTWIEVPEYSLTAPVLGVDGRVYIGDRGRLMPARASGVVAFDARTGERLSANPIAMGLPPYSLLAAR
ncbi:MAG: hypothetical protein U0269_10480 [Polyangiales bacterium]